MSTNAPTLAPVVPNAYTKEIMIVHFSIIGGGIGSNIDAFAVGENRR